MHGGNDCWMWLALLRRRRSDDAFDASDLGGHHAHMGGGHHGVFSAGHITADRGHRQVLVAEDDAGIGFLLHVDERGFLYFGEIAYLRLGEFDIGDILLGHAAVAGLDLGPGKAKTVRRPIVKFLRIIAQSIVAARLDVA